MNEIEPTRTEPPHGAGAPRAKRWALLLLAALVGLLWFRVVASPAIPSVLGFSWPGVFFDLYGSLAAREAVARGMNPYDLNPLDPNRRPHLYANWWLAGAKSGVWRKDTMQLGAAMIVALGLASLAVAAAGGVRTVLLSGLVLVSPAALFAVYRANNDLVIFGILVVALGCLQAGTRVWRLLAVVLIAAAAVLKYFPVAGLLVILSAPDRKSVRLELAAAALVLGLGVPACLPALPVLRAGLFQPGGWYTFGDGAWARTAGVPASRALLLGVAVLAAGAATWWLRRASWSAISDSARRRAREAGLVLGCGMMATCFVIDGSFAYKAIFILCAVPWLAEDAARCVGRIPARVLTVAMLTPLWIDGVLGGMVNLLGWHAAVSDRLSEINQPFWWAQFAVCAGVLASWAAGSIRRLTAA